MDVAQHLEPDPAEQAALAEVRFWEVAESAALSVPTGR